MATPPNMPPPDPGARPAPVDPMQQVINEATRPPSASSSRTRPIYFGPTFSDEQAAVFYLLFKGHHPGAVLQDILEVNVPHVGAPPTAADVAALLACVPEDWYVFRAILTRMWLPMNGYEAHQGPRSWRALTPTDHPRPGSMFLVFVQSASGAGDYYVARLDVRKDAFGADVILGVSASNGMPLDAQRCQWMPIPPR